MTNSAAAENLAGRAADKEKVEKRRALGRGLESLLPGPRVVAPPAPIVIQTVVEDAPQAPPFAKRMKDGAPALSSLPAGAELRSGGQPGCRCTGCPLHTLSRPTARGRESLRQSPAGQVRRHRGPLIPPSADGESITIFAQADTSRVPGNLVVNLDIADIDKNPFQTRYVEENDALEELADSIRANGVVQPIMVRPAEEEGRYILILGERRLHASKKAGKTTIPALVRRVSLQQAAEMTIIENLQREDLSALEQAEAFRVLSQEFSLTQQQIGERVGLSRESVSNYMRLLKLPREVMQLLAEKKITFGEAKELLKLANDDQISKAALYAVKKGMTLEQVERMVLSMNGLLDPFPGMPGEVVKKSERGAVGGSECAVGAAGPGADAGSEGEDPRP